MALFRSKAEDKVRKAGYDPARLPPGQYLTDKWPVLHAGDVPKVDLATWTLELSGAVEEPVSLTYEQLRELPATEVTTDIHCVTRWSRYDNLWEGVAIKEVLRRAVPKTSGYYVVIHAAQGFTTNLPLTELDQDDVLLADTHDGEALTPDHGWPLRLVVPRRYFWKSAKWVERLEVVAADAPGFWERNGYHNEADPWREERFSDW